eukprot:CAMPEP_0118970178 /NCGR_PEP_ID=MMETSP1173-20130426/7124_1 /TAXON_ID=1034831 /ORGANISM="Rhizochromulina marina cf, Strain CCMP1243" /LENGTH=996 /DNA_ID=CAMNT_0006919503 /DNA_START=1 /DNA_END=2991 /DNA_ORIENTATION=-
MLLGDTSAGTILPVDLEFSLRYQAIAQAKKQSKRVAVIGGGVAGLGCAWHLCKSKDHQVHVFEAEPLLGGHANTITIPELGGLAVDTGFMVYNDQNYPNINGLFAELGVVGQNTDMSFSVSMDGGRFEWSGTGLNGLFACRKHLVSPSFYLMLRDMLRFNREAPDLLRLPDQDPRKAVTMREYLRQNRYSEAFAKLFLIPMVGAVWSASEADVLSFPALSLIAFFNNHQMLQVVGRPQWRTPARRSREYVDAIAAELQEQGASVRTSCPIAAVDLQPAGEGQAVAKTVVTTEGEVLEFDEVVFACHPDTARGMLKPSQSPAQAEALAGFKYAENAVYVHSDPLLMPQRRRAWACWNYGLPEGEAGGGGGCFVTYWLNALQHLPEGTPDVFLSLNPPFPPRPELTYRKMAYSHPQYSPGAVRAQVELTRLQGDKGLWFCGAYLGYGFHEDGLRTGLQVAAALSHRPVPWMESPSHDCTGPAQGLVSLVHPSPMRRTDAPKSLAGALLAPIASLLAPLRRALSSVMVNLCRRAVAGFLRTAVTEGHLSILLPDGERWEFGADGAPAHERQVLRVLDDNFFLRVALQYDLGLARSYTAGEWQVPEDDQRNYTGLTDLFHLFIRNRERDGSNLSVSHLVTSWGGYFMNWLNFRFSMDNSLTGSKPNIEAHYDLSNDLFRLFLDNKVMMYSSAIYDTTLVRSVHGAPRSAPDLCSSAPGAFSLGFKGTLEEAEVRKVDVLIERAQLRAEHTLLDIGFGWGGLSIRAAETVGCHVVGITLSKEQKQLAEAKVKDKGLEHLVSFELVDYRTFAAQHPAVFDRIISCEMIEAVGHNYLGAFFSAVDRLLKPGGIFVMEAITTPECRYDEVRTAADFINTVIFPGSCCPSLQALLTAMAAKSNFSLERLDNINLHYAETLREWRRRFNQQRARVRDLGFDELFVRCWNYYLCYCEAGFDSQTLGCLILVFARQCTRDLAPLGTTSAVVRESLDAQQNASEYAVIG